MNTHTCESWFLWALTLLVLVGLALTRQWDGLIIAVLVSSVLWYAIVPKPHSGRQ